MYLGLRAWSLGSSGTRYQAEGFFHPLHCPSRLLNHYRLDIAAFTALIITLTACSDILPTYTMSCVCLLKGSLNFCIVLSSSASMSLITWRYLICRVHPVQSNIGHIKHGCYHDAEYTENADQDKCSPSVTHWALISPRDKASLHSSPFICPRPC